MCIDAQSEREGWHVGACRNDELGEDSSAGSQSPLDPAISSVLHMLIIIKQVYML